MSDNLARRLYWASSGGLDQEVLELLQRGVPPNSDYYTRVCDGETPLHWACADNHLRCAELLIKFGAIVAATANDGWTPLHKACYYNNKATAKLLLEHHCPPDIEKSSSGGQTAADLARERGHRALADYLEGF
ncbi:ankyrin repeat domain-containing protein 49-like [Halichondria panicea]|uniref:ankyrin repeat domain-containing protein 49-like n=1 Tax=Halichondria panicea TaxID=6063 RepID=UPI00312B78CB